MAEKKIDIRELTQDDRNLNIGTSEGEELIKQSIGEDGLGRSILTDKHGKIIAGNKTTKAALANGIQKARVIETTGDELIVVKRTDLDLDTDAKARRMAFRDNATAAMNLNWDFEEMEAQAVEFEFDVEGWVETPEDEEETHIEAKDDEYEIPETVKTDIVPGDLFEFRKGDLRHRLLCGDSTSVDDVERLMDGEKANMIFTDPPHEVEQDNFISYLDLFCNGVKFILHNDSYLSKLAAQYIDRFERFFVHDFIFHIGGGNRFFTQNDLIACFDYDSEIYNNLHDGFSTVVRKMTERQKGTDSLPHPHAKPIYLVEQFITHFSKSGNTLIDLYMGSGTTMVASHQLQRNCYGMEIDPKYCQVILDRMLKLDPDLEVTRNGEKYTTKNIDNYE